MMALTSFDTALRSNGEPALCEMALRMASVPARRFPSTRTARTTASAAPAPAGTAARSSAATKPTAIFVALEADRGRLSARAGGGRETEHASGGI